ncbi:MAG: EscU/YscU/HrcU family type III secretion system export apparatus switch protein [Acetobacteraceae bacterium]
MADDNEDRTEAATPRRLMKAREEGSVALSRELSSLGGLAAVTIVLLALGPTLATGLASHLAGLFAHAGTLRFATNGSAALGLAAAAFFRAAAPFALAALLGGVGFILLQTGILFRFETVMPDLTRLSPARWARRIIGADGLFEQGKSLLKLVVVAATVWHVLGANLSAIGGALGLSPAGLIAEGEADILALLWPMLVALGLISIGDMLWVRLRHAASLRMSREELRQELKETEGDPQIKAQLRKVRNARMKRRMLGAVKKATVVVTNPTHYAVALSYERGRSAAPRVVAKGVDAMAARIREIAEAHRVPVVANPPLARALYQVEVDTEIAPEHYKAVAEIIAYVWRLARPVRPPVTAAPGGTTRGATGSMTGDGTGAR